MSNLLGHCHGEKTHFSRNEEERFRYAKRTMSSLLGHCHGEKTHFSRNEKEG